MFLSSHNFASLFCASFFLISTAVVAAGDPKFCSWALSALGGQYRAETANEVTTAVKNLKSGKALGNELTASGAFFTVARAALDPTHVKEAMDGLEAAANSPYAIVQDNLRDTLPGIILDLERLERLEAEPARRAQIDTAVNHAKAVAAKMKIEVPKFSEAAPGKIESLGMFKKFSARGYIKALAVERFNWSDAKSWQEVAQVTAALKEYTDLDIIEEVLPGVYLFSKLHEYLQQAGLAQVNGLQDILADTFNTLMDKVEAQLYSPDWAVRNKAQNIFDHMNALANDPKYQGMALTPIISSLAKLDRATATNAVHRLANLVLTQDPGAVHIFGDQPKAFARYFFSSGGIGDAVQEVFSTQDMGRVRQIQEELKQFWDVAIAVRYSPHATLEMKDGLAQLSMTNLELNESISNRLMEADPTLNGAPQAKVDRFDSAKARYQKAINDRDWDTAIKEFQTAAYLAQSFLGTPEMATPMLDTLLQMFEYGLGQNYILESDGLMKSTRLRATLFWRMMILRGKLVESAKTNPMFQRAVDTSGKIFSLSKKEQAIPLIEKLLVHNWNNRLAYPMTNARGDRAFILETDRLSHILERLKDPNKSVVGDATMELKLLILFHKNQAQQGNPASKEFIEVVKSTGLSV